MFARIKKHTKTAINPQETQSEGGPSSHWDLSRSEGEPSSHLLVGARRFFIALNSR